MDRHDVACDFGQVLTKFRLASQQGNQMQYQYTCCALRARMSSNVCSSNYNSGGCAQNMISSNCQLRVQDDGNMVLYNYNNVKWASSTNGKGAKPYFLTLRENGNLVLSDNNKVTLWQSNTGDRGVGPFRAIAQDVRTPHHRYFLYFQRLNSFCQLTIVVITLPYTLHRTVTLCYMIR